MPRVWEQQEIEVFLGLDQRLHNQQRILWMNIVVHQSVGQEKFPFESIGKQLIRLTIVISYLLGAGARLFDQRRLKQSLPLLAPVVLIIAIVVIARARNSDLVKFGIA